MPTLYTLKPNKKLKDRHRGVADIDSAVIVFVEQFQNPRRKHMRFVVAVWASELAVETPGLTPLDSYEIEVPSEKYMTYFDPTFKTPVWKQIKNYLAIEGLPGGIDSADWQVDPQAEP